jgi:hypothetical protein
MRAIVGFLACLAAMTSLATENTAPAPLPAYHLHGYYKLLDNIPTWQQSDPSAWQVVQGEPWINKRLVKWGYVPMTHDAQNYYCLINDGPRTGSHVTERIFVCGDPKTVEWVFNTGRTPTIPLYAGP